MYLQNSPLCRVRPEGQWSCSVLTPMRALVRKQYGYKGFHTVQYSANQICKVAFSAVLFMNWKRLDQLSQAYHVADASVLANLNWSYV